MSKKDHVLSVRPSRVALIGCYGVTSCHSRTVVLLSNSPVCGGGGGIFRLHTVPYWLHSPGSDVPWFLIWFSQLRTFRLVQSRESKIKNNLKIKQM